MQVTSAPKPLDAFNKVIFGNKRIPIKLPVSTIGDGPPATTSRPIIF